LLPSGNHFSILPSSLFIEFQYSELDSVFFFFEKLKSFPKEEFWYGSCI